MFIFLRLRDFKNCQNLINFQYHSGHKMPLRKHVKTLRKLCLRSVVRNMHHWSADYKENYFDKAQGPFRFIAGPFSEIDAGSVQALMKILIKHNYMSKLYLHLLIVPSLKEIDLSGASKYTSNEIVELICIRCTNMTNVNLSRCDRVSASCLLKVVTTFQSTLVNLSLSNTKANNKVLGAIGVTCHNLRVLEIDMCKISRLGLSDLFYEEGTGSVKVLTPPGKSLRRLHMVGCSFDGDIEFITQLLLNCRSLRSVMHFSLWESIVRLCKRYKDPPKLGLVGVKYGMEIDFFHLRDDEKILTLLPKCLPHIQHLSLRSVALMEMPIFHLISECGNTLRSIKMDWCFPIDFLYYIGVLCPNLDTLMIDSTECQGYVECACEARAAYQNFISNNKVLAKGNKPFSKLEQFSIYWSPPDSTTNLPSLLPVVETVLKAASASLIYIDFHWMPDEDTDDFLQRALQSKCFENLGTLRLSGAVHLTTKSVWDLIMSAPKLKMLDITSCPQIMMYEFLDIAKYLYDNNLAIKVDHEF